MAAARRYSVEERLRQFGSAAKERLGRYFRDARLSFPPHRMALIAFKDERSLQLHAADRGASWRFVRTYRILGASGELGPKLREGDRQVPEGIYRIALLNANSKFHVSLRLDYPNAFDCEMARADGRDNLGCDIMIHGSSDSAGCLAVGDTAAEELFALAAMTPRENSVVIICPTDLRRAAPPSSAALPRWAPHLYARLLEELAPFPQPLAIRHETRGFPSAGCAR